MPGIFTHNLIVQESLEYLKKKKDRNYLSRSIRILFNNDYYRRVALFGALGPDIFDYVPLRHTTAFGSRTSSILHDGGSAPLLSAMLDRFIAINDHANEWASIQRAYLYGFVSHIISDSLFHPFILYWSGFPDNGRKSEIHHFREQNLLFEYNMDLFFLYHYQDRRFKLEIDDMLIGGNGFRSNRFDAAVKDLLLGSLAQAHPQLVDRYVWIKGKTEDTRYARSIGYLDIVTPLIRLTHRFKQSKNEYIKKISSRILRGKHVYFDLLVRYPEPRQINRHVLNHHRARWVHPAGIPGVRYDSVEDILRECSARVADAWESIESILYGSREKYESIIEKISVNALTGGQKEGSRALKLKEPVRLRF